MKTIDIYVIGIISGIVSGIIVRGMGGNNIFTLVLVMFFWGALLVGVYKLHYRIYNKDRLSGYLFLLILIIIYLEYLLIFQ